MGSVQLKGKDVLVEGNFLKTGDLAPDFTLVNKDLENVSLKSFENHRKILATVPSLDTPVCSQESILINSLATKHPSVLFFIISKDLPFAMKRHCANENLTNIITLSDLRPTSAFSKDYGVLIKEGPLAGLMTRSVLVLDEKNRVLFSELVQEITALPDLNKAFSFCV